MGISARLFSFPVRISIELGQGSFVVKRDVDWEETFVVYVEECEAVCMWN